MTTSKAAIKRSWWRGLNKTLLDSEASQFLQEHGDRACEVARKAARSARNRKEHRQARHYSHLALHISELSGQKFNELRADNISASLVPSRLLTPADEVIE